MYRNLSLDSSTDSDVFYNARSSAESSLIKNNTPAILNSRELSGVMAKETITVSSVAYPEPQKVTTDLHSNEPIFPYGFGNKHPVLPPSPNDLNLPHNPFTIQRVGYYCRDSTRWGRQPPITETV